VIPAPQHARKFLEVYGERMARVEIDQAAAIVLQRGNPASLYRVQNIMPALNKLGRAIVAALSNTASA
jgi:hypothetical protein